jgi:hypothetical protein
MNPRRLHLDGRTRHERYSHLGRNQSEACNKIFCLLGKMRAEPSLIAKFDDFICANIAVGL